MNGGPGLAPIRKTVMIDCPVAEAFRVFTTEAISWWPIHSHSIHGSSVTDVVFEPREGGAVYELASDGRTARWATVVAWEPPTRIVLAWQVNPSSPVTEVEIRFGADGDRTRLELEHRGWEADQDEGHSSYQSGWDLVLGRFADRVRRPVAEDQR